MSLPMFCKNACWASSKAQAPVSADFWLLPELKASGFSTSTVFRHNLMERNYRNGATFGILENKLLSSSAMSRLHMPSMEVVYATAWRPTTVPLRLLIYLSCHPRLDCPCAA